MAIFEVSRVRLLSAVEHQTLHHFIGLVLVKTLTLIDLVCSKMTFDLSIIKFKSCPLKIFEFIYNLHWTDYLNAYIYLNGYLTVC